MDKTIQQRTYSSTGAQVFQQADDAWKNGKYDEARMLYGKSTKEYSATDDVVGQAQALSRLGELELSLDEYQKSEQALLMAVDIIKDVVDAEITYAEILIKLAKLKSREIKNSEALSYVAQSRKVADSIGNYNSVGDSYDLEALIHLQENDEKSALSAYKKAAQYHEKSGISLKEAATLRAIARLEIKNKNYDYAHDVLEKCRELYRENGDLLGEASALSAIGSLRYIIKDIENARKALMKSIYLYGKVSHHFAEAEALLYLARVESFDSPHASLERAKTYYKRSISLFDFLGNEMMKEVVLLEYQGFLKRIGE